MLRLTWLQPAWHGERYSTPLSPQTGWKMESGHEQSLRQAGGCGYIELDVLPETQETGTQTKQDQRKTSPLWPSASSRLVSVPTRLCLGPAPLWGLNHAYWGQWGAGCWSVLMAPLRSFCHWEPTPTNRWSEGLGWQTSCCRSGRDKEPPVTLMTDSSCYANVTGNIPLPFFSTWAQAGGWAGPLEAIGV